MKQYKYIKKLNITAYSIFLICLLSACNKNFETINTDPTQLSRGTMVYEYEFTAAQVYMSANSDGYENGAFQAIIAYAGPMIQHISSTATFYVGDKYIDNEAYNAAYWHFVYPTGVKAIVDVVENVKTNPKKTNLYNISRILKVWYYQQMTDCYGDIPYTQAGTGYTEGVTNPVYDKQQDIYLDMLNELKEAATALDANAENTLGAGDLFYNGDVSKWKEFAYSEMLRLAMRLTKVDPATAQKWANTAVAGGLMQSNDDNALLVHEDQAYKPVFNPIGREFHDGGPNNYRVSETFINYLKSNNDPRLRYFTTVATDPTNPADLGNSDPAIQLGQPNGYDVSTGANDISKAPNWPGNQNKYSIVNRVTFAREAAPTFILTYSETELLLAEGIERGWISGSAATTYGEGVKAAILQLNQTGANLQQSDADSYLAANPYVATKGLEMINTQIWVSTFTDWLETWANWRRSGFPILTPVNYPGNSTGGTIPRRFTYPLDEATVNQVNYLAAIARLQGGNKMTSRIWWDK